MIIYSTRNIKGIPVCNSSLKIKDIVNYKNTFSTLYINPIVNIIEAIYIYYTENCPGYYIYIRLYVE